LILGELLAVIIVTFLSTGLSEARVMFSVTTLTTKTRKPFIRIFEI
jgi:hypothetical protein